jgi:ribose transport system permease protein
MASGESQSTAVTEVAPRGDLPPVEEPRPARARPNAQQIRQALLVASFFAMILFFYLEKPHDFLTSTNIHNLIDGMPVLTGMAVAVTIVLVLGEFDLSVPNVAELTSVVVAILLVQSHIGIVLVLILGLLVGVIAGTVNGAAVGYGRASAFVVTLAVGSMCAGIELLVQGKISLGQTSISPSALPHSLAQLSTSHWLGFEVAVWIFLAVAIVVGILMVFSTKGRHIQAIGGNEIAARLAGVAVKNTKVLAFAATGLLAAFSGVLFTARTGYFAQSLPSYLLPAYAAAFFGAAAIGRRGFSVPATLFGALYLATLANGLTVMSEPLWVISVVQGGVLLFAVLVARTS